MPRDPNPDVEWRVYYVDLGVSPPQLHWFDNTKGLGTPEAAQAYQDHFVLCVFQKQFEGTSTERITLASRYVYLEVQKKWTEATVDEIAQYAAARPPIELSAILEGQNLPQETFQSLVAWIEGDFDFPAPAEPDDYGIGEESRFDVQTDKDVTILDGVQLSSRKAARP